MTKNNIKLPRANFYNNKDIEIDYVLYNLGRINSDISQLIQILLNYSIKDYPEATSISLQMTKYLLLSLKEALKYISHVLRNEKLRSIFTSDSSEILERIKDELGVPKNNPESFNARILSKIRDDIAHYSIEDKHIKKFKQKLELLSNQDINMLFKTDKGLIEYELFTDYILLSSIQLELKDEMIRIAKDITLLCRTVINNHIQKVIK